MKILIIEDEKHNASRLQRLLTEISSEFEIVGVLETVRESVSWLEKKMAPDVILMDIRLSDGLSFDIFDKVGVFCPVIFTTSYDEYAVRAFKVNSIDYLLKPIEKNELEAALEKVDIERKKSVTSLELEQLLHLFKEGAPVFRKRFLLPRANGYKTLAVGEIGYIFTEQKITYLVTDDGSSEILRQTMDELEDELDPEAFFRANRQFIIHIDSVGMIRNDTNGKLKVVLKIDPAVEIIVSREKAPLLKKWLDR
ncbi:MAG: LytTR family DNA-binding domain-containing protein [Massilibacteroides sp.]|nr:LytTR family DNA-binding domain-containing protein [Massilibacteroides sp.]MDD3061347.1 LytTR family DNA-binding domain-containing protein [Massilibacteroides sp.]MDD4114643.1 LytTR family DNA-binding domain-containing protein [Massilibacteroides sp.]MDD4659438.1 LytTR family DNA-binding domain-containing protein [Massilibacteroides sp.]